MENNILNDLFDGKMGIDSSSFIDIDKQLSDTDYRKYLIDNLQPILDKRFPNDSEKRVIASHYDRIAFACPYCGDSMEYSHKKRGNFILSGQYSNFFKCHNCGQFKRIDEFFNDYKVILDLSAINYISNNLGDFKHNKSHKYDMSIFMDMEELDKYAFDREFIKKSFNLSEVYNTPIHSWLKRRLQFNNDLFLYNQSENYLAILNLTKSGKILGFQKRLFKGINRFQTNLLSKIYKTLELNLDISEEQRKYLDILSSIFNICLINLNSPVTLFEGPMDSFLYKNSIANTGANKSLPIEFPVRYWYDSDETGIKRSLEKINKGFSVFLWTKLINDLHLPKKKKYDLNDLIIYLKENNLKIPYFDNYFSSDPLDAIDI